MGEFRLNPETLGFSIVAKSEKGCPACSNKSESIVSFPFKKDYARVYELKNAVQPSKYALEGQFFKSSAAHGYEEIIVDQAGHGDRFKEYSIEDVEQLFSILGNRVRDVLGYGIGGNICAARHSGGHGVFDLVALPIPKSGERNCFQCDYVKKVGNREIHRTETISAYVPFAPVSDVQVNIAPVRHASIVDLDPVTLFDLADTLKKVVAHIGGGDTTIALLEYGDGHFHVEVHNRLVDVFELLGINEIGVVPEILAKEFMGKLSDGKDK